MFVSREYVKYYVFWHGLSKKSCLLYIKWSLKRTVCSILHLLINSCYYQQPFISGKSWWIGEKYNPLSNLREFYNWVHVKSYHNIPHFFPKKCEIYFQGSTVLCKYDYLYILRPRQENWNQPHHGHAAFMKGYWRKSRQRESYVQSRLMR